MKKINLLPNFITAFGLTCGLFIIFRLIAPAVDVSRYETLRFLAIILIIAGIADLLDGAVARRIRATSDFGEIFDSLSDAVVFGVAPAAMVLKGIGSTPDVEWGFVLMLTAMVYTICGVLRLARYNATAHSAREDLEQILALKKNFTGLPIPAAAGALVSCNLFLHSKDGSAWLALSDQAKMGILGGVMLLLGYLMVSRWKFPSLKALQLRLASFHLVFTTVMVTVLFFYGLLYHFAVLMVVTMWTYVLMALALSFIRLLAGRKSRTLEDFEPEPEIEEEP